MSVPRNRTVVWGRQALVGLAILVASAIVVGQSITIPNTFTNNTVADAPQVNANFAALASNALNRNAGTMLGTLNSQAVVPTSDNTYDLGSSTFYFRDLYVKRTAFINGLRGCDVRLTLTSGTPVTTADVTGAASVFATPYVGSGGGPAYCAFFDGVSTWAPVPVVEVQVSLGTLSSGLPYDVFCFNSSGTMACDAPVAWTNTTTRATALATQNGVLVKSGTTTRRYFGTFLTTSTTTTEDSATKRDVWNYYNRVRRPVVRLESTVSWTYNLAAYRQANGSAANQIEIVVGVAEVPLDLRIVASAGNNAANTVMMVAISEDSTTTPSTSAVIQQVQQQAAAGLAMPLSSSLVKYPAIGRHFYAWLEFVSVAAGATTFIGTTGTGSPQSGLIGIFEG